MMEYLEKTQLCFTRYTQEGPRMRGDAVTTLLRGNSPLTTELLCRFGMCNTICFTPQKFNSQNMTKNHLIKNITK